MKVYYISNDSYYESIMIDGFIANNIELIKLNNKEFVSTYKKYCTIEPKYKENGKEEVESCFIMDSLCNTLIATEIIQYANIGHLLRRPRMILISTLLTWGGVTVNTSDASNQFKQRTSCIGNHCQFELENIFWTMSSATKAEAFIIGMGMLYGGSGFDFGSFFRKIWNGQMGNEDTLGWSMPSLTNGNNIVPSIYYEDFVSLMLNILQPNITTNDIDNNSTWNFPTYIPAVDCSTSSILDTFTSIAGDKSTFSTDINKSKIIDSVMTDPRNQLWSLNICFSNNSGGFPSNGIAQKYKNGLNDESLLKTLWDNYLSINNLSPVSIMIAGPSSCGKTTISKAIAEKLNLQYIDVPSSLRYLMDTFPPPIPPVVEPIVGEIPVISSTKEVPTESEVKPSIYQSLRAELCKSLETKMGEPKKLKKGEEPIPVDVSTAEFTDALCIQIEPSIIRRSIAAYIKTSKKCNLTGYLIDIWSLGVLTNISDYLETITGKTEETGDNKSKLVELVIELQLTDEVLMKRLMEKLGVVEGTQAKASKENQALLKALETSCATYKEKMKEVPDSNNPEINITSHEVIIEISNSARDNGTTLYRLNTSSISIDDCVVSLLPKIVEVHGKIGWVDIDATVQVNAIIDELKEEIKEEKVIVSNPEVPIVKSTPTIQSGMDKVNSNIINLVPEDQVTLLAKCDVLQSFLGVTILPYLTQGMVLIARQYPDDPIMFLAEYLKQKSIEVEEQSEAAAKLDFYNTLELAKSEEF